MLNFIDLILLAVVAYFFFMGIKRGFTRTLLSFLARIASIVAAYFVSDMYDDVVYEKFFIDYISSSLEQTVAGPIAIAVCRIVIFVLVSAVASLVLNIVINAICNIVKLPVLRTANKLLGAVLGLVNGLLCVFVVSFICTIALSFIDNAEFTEAVSSSYIIDLFAYTDMLI